MIRYLVFIGLAFLNLSCTHSIHLVQVSDFAPTYKALNQGTLVQSKAEQSVFMGFTTETNYVNEAYNKLQDNCMNGSIQAIKTQYITSHGFFSWVNSVEMQGLCVK